MNVEQLIEELRKMPPHMDVLIEGHCCSLDALGVALVDTSAWQTKTPNFVLIEGV